LNDKSGYGRVLRDHAVVPKKRLGQHFMIDPALLSAIARLMVPEEGRYVAVEIGPGIGTLTKELAARTNRVYALEMDTSLGPVLSETIAGLANVEILWGDALEFDLTGEKTSKDHPGTPLMLCGNLPYYITSEVLYSAIVKRCRWSRLAFVVQEEVGERMAASPGSKDFGRLSLWCQYRTTVVISKRISRGSFVPRPDVGSCLVTLDVKPEFPLDEREEQILDSISRAAFSKRRKTLHNSLKEIIPDNATLSRVLVEAAIDPNRRPEDLRVGEFENLARIAANASHLIK